jgi:hypothetical protein
MLELKIQCAGCGQKYKFDVEPVNGRMPWAVQCPVCKADGTETANAALAGIMPEGSSRAASAVRVSSGPMRISAAATGEASSQGAFVAPELPPLTIPPMVRTAPVQSVALAKLNFNLGIVGAIAGALIGMIGWYLLIRVVHHTIGYAAVGVGALAGFGARLLAKQGSHSLGIVAAICGVVAILLGQFLAIRSLTSAQIAEMLEGAYDEHMVYAKEAVKAKTDEDIKAVVAKSENSDSSDPEKVDARAIQTFRQKELPTLQKFVNGIPAKAEYQRQQLSKIEEFVGPLVLQKSFGLFTILWIFLGTSSAYRVAKA